MIWLIKEHLRQEKNMEKRKRKKHLRQQRNEETGKKYLTFNEAKK
jgi:hypothetical protein